jgi:hypothetical protein
MLSTRFLQKVRRAVRPGGSLVIVDRSALTASDELSRLDTTRVRRELLDGRTFTIVTVPCDPVDVARRLGLLGFEVAVRPLGDTWFFLQAQTGTSDGVEQAAGDAGDEGVAGAGEHGQAGPEGVAGGGVAVDGEGIQEEVSQAMAGQPEDTSQVADNS